MTDLWIHWKHQFYLPCEHFMWIFIIQLFYIFYLFVRNHFFLNFLWKCNPLRLSSLLLNFFFSGCFMFVMFVLPSFCFLLCPLTVMMEMRWTWPLQNQRLRCSMRRFQIRLTVMRNSSGFWLPGAKHRSMLLWINTKMNLVMISTRYARYELYCKVTLLYSCSYQ